MPDIPFSTKDLLMKRVLGLEIIDIENSSAL